MDMTNPTQVDLLKDNGALIRSYNNEHMGSMNNDGSEETASVRISGPVGATAWFYDDQDFRRGQNYVRVTKEIADPIEVRINRNFIEGTQINGQYVAIGTGWSAVLFKNVETHWYNAKWFTDALQMIGDKLQENMQQQAANDPNNYEYKGGMAVGAGISTAAGLLKKGETNSSDNNHVDNLSSMAWGPSLHPEG